MIRYFLEWIFRSIWKAALVGIAVGAAATAFVIIFDSMFGATSGHGNSTFILMILIKGPQVFLFDFLGLLNTEEYRSLLSRYGWLLTFGVNSLFTCVLFVIISVIWKIVSSAKRESHA